MHDASLLLHVPWLLHAEMHVSHLSPPQFVAQAHVFGSTHVPFLPHEGLHVGVSHRSPVHPFAHTHALVLVLTLFVHVPVPVWHSGVQTGVLHMEPLHPSLHMHEPRIISEEHLFVPSPQHPQGGGGQSDARGRPLPNGGHASCAHGLFFVRQSCHDTTSRQVSLH